MSTPTIKDLIEEQIEISERIGSHLPSKRLEAVEVTVADHEARIEVLEAAQPT
jgi:hypothetical protein